MKKMCLFVHAVGTTGQDARARREHAHGNRCAQCLKRVEQDDRVAAHVVAYPCGNGCCGWLTLRTTCKACNARSTAKTRRRSAFWGCAPRLRRLRCLCCAPSCAPYDASRP